MELLPERREELSALCDQLGLRDVDLCAFNQAFSHRSYMNEHGYPESESNERLEFLGDSVLGAVVTEYLYHEYPDLSEGQLSKIKSVVVSRRLLSRVARALDLGRCLLLGRGEDQTGGRIRMSILANVFEAVLGAYYVNCGFEATRQLALRLLAEEIESVVSGETVADFKSSLQELTQRRWGVIPRYRVVKTEGPDHDKMFEVEARMREEVLGAGTGKSKKNAEQRAAQAALDALHDETQETDGE